MNLFSGLKSFELFNFAKCLLLAMFLLRESFIKLYQILLQCKSLVKKHFEIQKFKKIYLIFLCHVV